MWHLERKAAVVVLMLASCRSDDNERRLGPPMDPSTIPKFDQPLAIPRVMPPSSDINADEYRIAARQFQQQVLPPPMPATTVWGYGRDGDSSTFSYPGPTVETRGNRPVRVTWVNGLVDDEKRFLPHLVPVDSTIHWADPGGTHTTDGHNHDREDALYTGPVPMVTHVHGAHSFDHSDGHPEAWFLPDATDIPAGFVRQGPHYTTQADVRTGAAVYDYPQDEDATTLWYHDHSLGITRANIYAGLAGFWLIRDEFEDQLDLPGPAPRLGDAPDTRYYEVPLVIQDKTFAKDGSLWYPSSRTDYDGYTGPFIPGSDVPPIWGPEFIGNAMLVNGRAWPFLEVEPRLYRFRILNASDARTLIMSLDQSGIDFIQIGADGGFMFGPPARQTELLLGPAERVDVLVDFSSLSAGDTVTLLNTGPDDPWGGPDADQDPADPTTTGQIMQFRVVPLTTAGNAGTIPTTLLRRPTLQPTAPDRDLLLAELDVDDMYPTHVLLGTVLSDHCRGQHR